VPSPESSGGQDLDDRFIRGFPRAEDQVDEHHGLEDSAQAAETSVALVVLTSVGSYCARITELLATPSQYARLLA
jgi:hypothetical protein